MTIHTGISRKTPDVRREQIIAVASEVFGKYGYALTSMASIAHTVGGSKSTLYKYFPSKELLFLEVIKSLCEIAFFPLKKYRITCENDLNYFLLDFGTRYLGVVYGRAALDALRLIGSEGAHFPDLAEAFFSAGPNTLLEEVCTALERFAAVGEIVCDDPELAAGQFLGLLLGDKLSRVLYGLSPPPSSAEISYQVRMANQIFLCGLCRG